VAGFLVDGNLPVLLATTLRQEGYPAEHIKEVGLQSAKDNQIWDYALEKNAAIITKDVDFSHRITVKPQGPAIVWVQCENMKKQAQVDWFMPFVETAIKRINEGEKLVIISQ